MFLLCLVLARLYMRQIVEYEHFSTLSDSNRVRIKALPPTRGLIFDRNGVVMANNLPTYRLEIVREQVEDLEQTLAAASKLRRNLRRTETFSPILGATSAVREYSAQDNLNDEEVARLAVNLHQFEGIVEINARLTRHYPGQGEHAVHALGYVGRIDEKDLGEVDEVDYAGTTHIGKLGLEKFYEHELHGTVGVQQVEVNANGRTLRVLNETPPIQGNNLHLTIDSRDAAGGRGSLCRSQRRGGGDRSQQRRNPRAGVDADIQSQSVRQRHQLRVIQRRLRDSPERPTLFNRALSGQYPRARPPSRFSGWPVWRPKITNEDHQTFCFGHYQLPNEERKYATGKRLAG